MNFTTKYWMEIIIVVEILLIGNTAGNLSLASPPLLTIQIRFVTGIEALSLFHSLEWKLRGGDWWVIQILSDRDDQCILLGLNIVSILEFLGEERFGEYFLCVLN